MFGEGEIGRVKNVFTKLHFSLIPNEEEAYNNSYTYVTNYDNYKGYSIEVYESENFVADTCYNLEVEDDFFCEYDLTYRYFNIKRLVKEYEIKPLEICTILVNYDMVYTKGWTDCGYEYDMELDIKEVQVNRHQNLEFNTMYKTILPKWTKYPIKMEYNKNRLWEKLVD